MDGPRWFLGSVAVACLAVAATLGWPSPSGAAGANGPGADGSGVVRPVDGDVVVGFDGHPPADAPWTPGNRGVDLIAEPGEPVRAALDGVVAFSGTVAGSTWVTVDHGGGLVTSYGDVQATVPAGRPLRRGDVVGNVAPTAATLHWGARVEGEYIDPLALLVRWRPRLVPVRQ